MAGSLFEKHGLPMDSLYNKRSSQPCTDVLQNWMIFLIKHTHAEEIHAPVLTGETTVGAMG